MAFERPTLQEIDDRIQQDFKNRIEGSTSFLRRSMLKIMARVYAGAMHLMYGYLFYMSRQLFILTADTTYLEKHGNELGVTRTDAVKANGIATVTGTIGSVIPENTELESNSGLKYYIDEEVILTATTGSINFTAEYAGADYNDDAGISLFFVSPLAGIDSTATVDMNGITEGLDEEADDPYRLRILTRKRQPPHSGAGFDYVNWALEVSGVTRAWSFPEVYGIGTIGLAFVRDNDTSIIPTETQKEEVRDYIIYHTDPLTGLEVGIPVTAEQGFFVLDLELETLDFTLKITPNNSTARSEILSKLEDVIIARGGPGETLYLSDISQAIAMSPTTRAHKIIYPTDDIGTATNKVPLLGTVTFQDY